MKKTLKFLLPGALALAFFAAPSAIVPNVAAQDPAAAATPNPRKAELDARFRELRTKDRDAAYKVAKEYLAEFGNDTEGKEFADYLKGWIAKEDERNKATAELAIVKKCSDPVQAAFKATTAAEKTKFGNDIFTGCQQYASQKPDVAYPYLQPIDYGFILATSNPPVNTYNDQTIALAKQAMQKIESNSLGDVKWADYGYKSKDDALAWMNYIIGYITFNNLSGKEADAVPYLYKSLQYTSEIKDKPLPYYAIGFNYRTQYNKAVQDFQTKYANAESVTEPMKQDIGIQKALAERAIDAFARAYAAAKADPKLPPAAREARKKDLEQMYKIRYKDQTADLDALASTAASKPLPDPASPVTPVMEELTPTTTGTGGATAGMTATVETSKAGAESGSRAANATATKTANSTTAAKPAAGAKPAAAKPAPKKKPSR